MALRDRLLGIPDRWRADAWPGADPPAPPDWDRIADALRAVPRPSAPPDLAARIAERIAAAPLPAPAPPRAHPVGARSALVPAAMLALVVLLVPSVLPVASPSDGSVVPSEATLTRDAPVADKAPVGGVAADPFAITMRAGSGDPMAEDAAATDCAPPPWPLPVPAPSLPLACGPAGPGASGAP